MCEPEKGPKISPAEVEFDPHSVDLEYRSISEPTLISDDSQERRATSVPKKSEDNVDTISVLENDGLYAEDEYSDAPPDGGYGWICCACVAMINFATWGPNTCYGVFLSYFLSNECFPGATPTDYALIGGLVIGLTQLLLPLSALLMNIFGYKVVATIAVLIEFASFMGSSYVTTIGGLYCTYGLLLGLSFGLLYGCNTVVIPGWFLKKRAFANGVTHAGIGAGGVVWSFSVHAIIGRTGSYKWGMRMLAIASIFINTISMLFIKVRKPKNAPKVTKSARSCISEIYDVNVFKKFPLQLCTLWSSLTNIGYVILLFSLSNYALSIGLTTQQATNTLAMFNGAQIIGRPAMGYFSEKIGRTNMTIATMIYSLILLLPYWFNITTYSEMLSFGFILGLGAGIAAVNVVPLVADVTGTGKFPAGIGFNNFWNGICSIIAEVIGLKLRDYNLKKPYLYCQIFVALTYFAGLLCLFPYREWKVKRVLHARLAGNKLEKEVRTKYEDILQPGIVNYIKRTFWMLEA